MVFPRSHIKLFARELVQHLRKSQDEKKSASVYMLQRCDEVTVPHKILFSLISLLITKTRGRAEVWFNLLKSKQCPVHPAARAINEQKSLVGWKTESKMGRNRVKEFIFRALYVASEQVLKAAQAG